MNGHSSVPAPLVAATLLLAFSLLGCTIKEVRDDCPSQLILDLSEAYSKCDQTLLLSLEGGSDFTFADTLDIYTGPKEYRILVPRTTMTIYSCSPHSLPSNSHGGIRLKDGTSCPPLWFNTDTVKITGEYLNHKVILHKNHCQLTIKMVSEDNIIYPFQLSFISYVDGFDSSGRLTYGTYRQRVAPDGTGIFIVNIPRQDDNSLTMEITAEDSQVRSFALGEYISASGYDWKATDLEDLEIEINFARTTITVNSSQWTEHFEQTVKI